MIQVLRLTRKIEHCEGGVTRVNIYFLFSRNHFIISTNRILELYARIIRNSGTIKHHRISRNGGGLFNSFPLSLPLFKF